MAFDFIYKGFTKAVFSDDSGLNIIPSDLGEDMITVAFESEAVRRLKTAVGTIASPELFVDISLTMNILKTSPQYATYKERVSQNTIVSGNLTLYDDANQEWNFIRISLKPSGFSSSGRDATVPFVLQANWPVNTKLIAGIE